jgi:hypothetical protein
VCVCVCGGGGRAVEDFNLDRACAPTRPSSDLIRLFTIIVWKSGYALFEMYAAVAAAVVDKSPLLETFAGIWWLFGNVVAR